MYVINVLPLAWVTLLIVPHPLSNEVSSLAYSTIVTVSMSDSD